MAIDISQLIQIASFGFFFVFMAFGQKLQVGMLLAQIAGAMKKFIVFRDASKAALRKHILQHIGTITPEQDAQITALIDSVAIPPISHLDPQGIVPKMENIFKTYDRFLKNGLRKIVNIPGVEPISQHELENLTNSLEVTIELSLFYKIVEHFFKLAKKSKGAGLMWAYQLAMIMPMLLELAEAYNAAALHFPTGLPVGDGFGPMVARKFVENSDKMQEAEDISQDKETSVYDMFFEGRRVFVIKAKGPGGSVGNPGIITQSVIQQTNPSLVVTIDAASRLESEKTGDVSTGVGVAMGGPGMDRFRIEEALAGFQVPVLTVVCKMNMKEAISQMPKEVLDQVEPTYQKVQQMIRENSVEGETVVVLGVGNTMGVN